MRRSARHLTVGMALLSLASATLLGAGAPASARPLAQAPVPAGTLVLASPTPIDRQDRASVSSAYLGRWMPALQTTGTWNGSVAGCNPGTGNAAGDAATLDAVNFVRDLAGLGHVSLDAGYSQKNRAAALMFDANDTIDHYPPSSWTCYTADGAEAAAKSNLAMGWGTNAARYAGAVNLYMIDSGSGNKAAGHRRWLLNPGIEKIGTGTSARSNALWVNDGGTIWNVPAGTPQWVGWPTDGYFPADLEPAGRWSLTATDPTVDLSDATVTVRNAAGTALALTQHPLTQVYDKRTLVWDVTGIVKPAGADVARYTVTVAGITRGSATISHTYDVLLMNPASTPTAPFSDVPAGHPFYREIDWMKQTGLTTGYADGFRSLEPVTRQAAAAFLYRYSGDSFTPPATPSFPDVQPGSPFYREIEWMKACGMTTGYADGFRPLQPLTRQALAAFLYRYSEDSFTPPSTASFPDVQPGSPFYREIEWMSSTGMTTGYADGFRPEALVTRQATAAFLYRFNGAQG